MERSTAQAESGRITFDPHDPAFVEEGVPFDVLTRIRHEQPVYRTPSGSWYLSRYGDVEAALKDVDTFQAELGPITGIPGGFRTIPEDQHYLSEIPEPRHKAVRRLFNTVLGPHRMHAVEPVVTAECNRLVDAMLSVPVADLHDGYAAAIPAITMAELMGVGPGAVGLFMRWSEDGTLMSRPATPGVPEEGPATHPFFQAVIAAQRELPEPTTHVLRTLLGADVEGRPLSDREVVTQLHFMLQAGVHTTRAFLVHLMNRLVHDRELFTALDADRELIPRLLEESLRHDSPVQRTTRYCTRDTQIDGVAVGEGEWVEMGIGSANRDEAVYDDPDAFRLDRPQPREHLGFGAGSHVCPGATLARLEGTIAVQVLLDRVAEVRPVDGARYPPLPGSLGHQPVPAVLVAR